MSVDPLASFPAGGVAVVVGASGGIGSAVVRALGLSGRFDCVLGFGRAAAPPLELGDEASIAKAADLAVGAGELRLVFDATGVLATAEHGPERALREITPEAMAHQFAVNAIGPALLLKHFGPRLAREGKSVFATLSARVGSIGDNRLGGWYGYRAAKAALNQIVRSAGVELRRSHPRACVLALHPGTVDTRLSRGFAKQGLQLRTPEAAATRLLDVLDRATPELSGGFFDLHGAPIPW